MPRSLAAQVEQAGHTLAMAANVAPHLLRAPIPHRGPGAFQFASEEVCPDPGCDSCIASANAFAGLLAQVRNGESFVDTNLFSHAVAPCDTHHVLTVPLVLVGTQAG